MLELSNISCWITLINEEECLLNFNNFFSLVLTREDHSTISSLADVDYPYMSPIEISVTGIAACINNLKISTSTGVDNINTKILKNTVGHSSTILYHIFRQSLTTGEILADWKIGKTIPIFKSGDKTPLSTHIIDISAMQDPQTHNRVKSCAASPHSRVLFD